MSRPPSVGLVVNPKARAGVDQSARLEALRGRLEGLGWEVRVRPTTAAGGGGVAAAELAPDSDVLLALGGDGTFCEVVGGMLTARESRVRAVAPVSFGTGNDVAMQLGLHREEAVLRILAGAAGRAEALPVRRVDVLEVRCRVEGGEVVRHGFLFAGVGFASDILRFTTPGVKRWFGPRLSYMVGFFRALAAWKPVRLRVATERGEVDESLVVALAANAPHAGGGGMRIAPDAKIRDGLAEISLIRALGRFAIARQFVRLTRGTHITHPRVDYFRSTWMSVDSDNPQPVALDGDVVGETPMRVRVLPEAVPVLDVG